MSLSAEQLIRELHSAQLTFEQLKNHQQHVKILLERLQPESVDDETWVLSLIVDHLRNVGCGYTSVAQLKKSSAIKTFREQLPLLMRFFADQQLTRIQMRGIIGMGLFLLHRQMTDIKVPCGGTTVLRHINRIPALLETQFPGYARCGLLKLVVRSKQDTFANVRPQ